MSSGCTAAIQLQSVSTSESPPLETAKSAVFASSESRTGARVERTVFRGEQHVSGWRLVRRPTTLHSAICALLDHCPGKRGSQSECPRTEQILEKACSAPQNTRLGIRSIRWTPFPLALLSCSRAVGDVTDSQGNSTKPVLGHEPPRNRPRNTPFSAQLCS
ncbi:hypothetical protein EXIGLDRAFT_336481 [Exidia glandulosa HHB12029]|uniref:Uncharacterized protein n=1 Tax=Exidia glandulosa HHB12029 TaxID=1314781 RepID=A0A165CLU2_EXIGL|nr:hypothetical protein EXIGLDRAFT_336481 [Exidia glandulosa HHB12029]